MLKYLQVFIVSMVPILELRGAIPIGVGLGLPLWQVTLLAMFGNALIVPILLVITTPLFDYLRSLKIFKNTIERYENRAAAKLKHYRGVRFWGLLLLVGIPVPTTGVYTGVVAAKMLNMGFRASLLAICGGVVMSGSIVYMLVTVFHMVI